MLGNIRVLLFMAGVLALALVVIGGAALVGLWLGGRTSESDADKGSSDPLQVAAGLPLEGDETPIPDAPLFFSANTYPGADLAAVREEALLASQNGVHQMIVSVLLPWDDQTTFESLLTPLDVVHEAAPDAVFFLRVRLDPSQEWLTTHPDAIAVAGQPNRQRVSLESSAWQEAARSGLEGLAAHVADKDLPVIGYVLECLDDGCWIRNGTIDVSEANQHAFRAWLLERYHDDAGLHAAWGTDAATLLDARIPDLPDKADPIKVFFDLPEERPLVDLYEYTSERVARSLAGYAAFMKQQAGEEIQVLAPYGWTFEPVSHQGAHLALGDLFESPLDGFLGPVSSVDRGLGGVGGFIGPISSVRLNHKQWYQVEDTRTGITRNPGTGETELLPGLHLQDVFNVQKRNFASALAHGTALVWSDPDGTGALLDPGMWSSFAAMRGAYQTFWGELARQPIPDTLADLVIQPATSVTLTVVVDEASRFYQRDEEHLNRLLLQGARDAALLAGAPAQFCLLEDVLEGRAAASRVYLFANLFRLSEERRNRLHALLASQKAAAIWLYAPGYFAPEPSVEGLSATTGMPVRLLESPALSGSVCVLGDRIVQQGESFGETIEWNPLFCIEPPADGSVTALANYRDNEEASIALRFMPEGWASVYYAEPSITPDMLRQILMILQEHLYLRPVPGTTPDVALFGPGLVALHCRNETSGERTLDLRMPYHVQDLLDPDTGWRNKSTLDVTLRFGETRILQLTPSDESVPAEDPEVSPTPEDPIPEEALSEEALLADPESVSDAAEPSASTLQEPESVTEDSAPAGG